MWITEESRGRMLRCANRNSLSRSGRRLERPASPGLAVRILILEGQAV